MSVPAAEKEVTSADFLSAMAGFWQTGMHSEDVAVTFFPSGAVPVAVPVLEMEPWFTSAWVVV